MNELKSEANERHGLTAGAFLAVPNALSWLRHETANRLEALAVGLRTGVPVRPAWLHEINLYLSHLRESSPNCPNCDQAATVWHKLLRAWGEPTSESDSQKALGHLDPRSTYPAILGRDLFEAICIRSEQVEPSLRNALGRLSAHDIRFDVRHAAARVAEILEKR